MMSRGQFILDFACQFSGAQGLYDECDNGAACLPAPAPTAVGGRYVAHFARLLDDLYARYRAAPQRGDIGLRPAPPLIADSCKSQGRFEGDMSLKANK